MTLGHLSICYGVVSLAFSISIRQAGFYCAWSATVQCRLYVWAAANWCPWGALCSLRHLDRSPHFYPGSISNLHWTAIKLSLSTDACLEVMHGHLNIEYSSNWPDYPIFMLSKVICVALFQCELDLLVRSELMLFDANSEDMWCKFLQTGMLSWGSR